MQSEPSDRLHAEVTNIFLIKEDWAASMKEHSVEQESKSWLKTVKFFFFFNKARDQQALITVLLLQDVRFD